MAIKTNYVRLTSTVEDHADSTKGLERSHDQLNGDMAGPTGDTQTGQNQNATTNTMQNDDPMRRRLKNPGRGLIRRFLRLVSLQVIHKPLTPEQIAEKRDKIRRDQLAVVLQKDAETAAHWMIGCFDRLGYWFIRYDSEGRIRKQKHIVFDEVRAEEDAIHLHVDTHKLPHGVDIINLRKPETIDNLAASVGRAVSCSWTPEAGLWYTVERASGRAGIPGWVKYSDVIERMPASHSDSLSIPVGITNNARPIYVSLDKMPHCLVAGSTGAGKTNFLHVMACTLIRRNSPERVRLVLVDLKGGLAFARYQGIPHLFRHPQVCPDGIITTRETVQAMLDWLIGEGERRMNVLKEADCESIGQYNRHHRPRLSYLVMIIDEWADMMYHDDRKKAEMSLVNIVQRMRAVGFHIVVATQIPKSEVITGLIKGNLPCRFGFSVPNLHASLAILDDRSAVGLQPTGRAVMQFREQRQIQTPFISPEIIAETIKGAASGEYAALSSGHDVTETEVMDWAIEHNNGWLTRAAVYSHFRERGITIEELRIWLESWEGKQFLIGNSLYVVEPSTGNRGRRLVVVTDDTPDTPPNQGEDL